MVHVVENQSVSITITLNHVHAVVTWKRWVSLVGGYNVGTLSLIMHIMYLINSSFLVVTAESRL